MNTIPKKLKIGGFIWKVIESKDISYEGNCYGSTHFDSQTIYLNPDIPQQKKTETLLHEIIHACMWQCGLNRTFSIKDKEITEEDVVQPLSMILYQVFKDNGLTWGKE
jgi:Zn-dependent peptidase ImmA (M78 family)